MVPGKLRIIFCDHGTVCFEFNAAIGPEASAGWCIDGIDSGILVIDLLSSDIVCIGNILIVFNFFQIGEGRDFRE